MDRKYVEKVVTYRDASGTNLVEALVMLDGNMAQMSVLFDHEERSIQLLCGGGVCHLIVDVQAGLDPVITMIHHGRGSGHVWDALKSLLPNVAYNALWDMAREMGVQDFWVPA